MRQFLKNMNQSIGRALRTRRDRAELHEMSDYLLSDIGISRSMIDYYMTDRAHREGTRR